MIEIAIRKQLPGFTLEVDLQAGREVTVLFGPSGAGKSLVLQCVAGVVDPDAGRILLDGQVVFDAGAGVRVPAQRRRVGYVPQHYALFPHLTVVQQVAFGLECRPRAEAEGRVDALLHQMRLRGLERRYPGQLSGGQQQRVAVARALAVEPEVLLLDEPFSALDSVVRGRLIEDLLDLQERLGLTTLLVTHDLADAYTLADRIAVLDAGRVLQAGSKQEVFYRPQSLIVARLAGIRNLFEATVTAAGPDGLTLEASKWKVPAPPGPFAVGERVRWCIRPEAITLVKPDRRRNGDDESRLVGRIVREVDYGAVRTLFFKVGDEPARGYRDYDLEIRIGTPTYDVLGLGEQKRWTVALKRAAVHIIERCAPSAVSAP